MRKALNTGSTRVSRDSYAANIVETVRDPLVVLDSDLRVKSANRSFYQTFKVAAEQCEGKLLGDLGEGQWDIPELQQLLGQIPSQHSELRDFEVEHRFPGLGRRTMLLNGRLVRGGNPPLILLAIEDITERKRAEETRRLFLAATSHDVINALNNLVGYAELLENGGDMEPVAPRIISLSKALGEIMRDVLDHDQAETERPNLVPVSARSLVRDCAEAVEWRCKQKGLALQVELPSEGKITTDPVKLGRILDNLLSNAVRYTERGKVHVAGELATTNLSVVVRDTGIGIPPDDLVRVFDHYYRAPTAQQLEPLGTGLGLCTVKRFCDLLGGSAKIESAPGVGTTCKVVLPRRPPSAAPPLRLARKSRDEE